MKRRQHQRRQDVWWFRWQRHFPRGRQRRRHRLRCPLWKWYLLFWRRGRQRWRQPRPRFLNQSRRHQRLWRRGHRRLAFRLPPRPHAPEQAAGCVTASPRPRGHTLQRPHARLFPPEQARDWLSADLRPVRQTCRGTRTRLLPSEQARDWLGAGLRPIGQARRGTWTRLLASEQSERYRPASLSPLRNRGGTRLRPVRQTRSRLRSRRPVLDRVCANARARLHPFQQASRCRPALPHPGKKRSTSFWARLAPAQTALRPGRQPSQWIFTAFLAMVRMIL